MNPGCQLHSPCFKAFSGSSRKRVSAGLHSSAQTECLSRVTIQAFAAPKSSLHFCFPPSSFASSLQQLPITLPTGQYLCLCPSLPSFFQHLLLLYSQESSLFSDALAFGYKTLSLSQLFLLSILPQPLLPEILFWVKEDEGFRLDFHHQYIPQLDILALWPPHSTTRYSYPLDVISLQLWFCLIGDQSEGPD